MNELAQRPAGKWADARKILLVRLDNLGDLIMTTPAIHAVRESLPEAKLTLLASPGGSRALPHLTDLDDVIVYDAPWSKAALPRPSDADRQLLRTLSRQRFDAAVIFTVCTQSALPAALMCRMAGIPLRLAHARENPYELLTDWVPDPDVPPRMRHEVARQLALVAHVGCRTVHDRLSFRYRTVDRARARRKLVSTGLDVDRPYIVVHPGASAPSRRYPADKFGEAAQLLAERPGHQILFTGGMDEAHLVEQARSRVINRGFSVAGLLTLGELAAVIDGASVVITNNSGPAHMAAALGTPVVDLYALTNPQHTPWRVLSRVLNHDVPCRNCFKSVCPEQHNNCLRLVAPVTVASAARELLDITARSSSHIHPLRTRPALTVVAPREADTRATQS